MQLTDSPRVAAGEAAAMRGMAQSLGKVPDPRTARRPVHALTNILWIALCAVVADCDSWEDIEDFGNERQAWFETFLTLSHGIPSRDTFRRVFARLQPRPFQQVLVQFIESLREPTAGDEGADDQHFAIDGKTLRSSFDHATFPGGSATRLASPACSASAAFHCNQIANDLSTASASAILYK